MCARSIVCVLAALVLFSVRPAMAGFRCGSRAKPKRQGSIGCDCPPDKQSVRDGSDWVCVTARPSVAVPELRSPPVDARDVDDHTDFSISLSVPVDEVEVQLCPDPTCERPWRNDRMIAAARLISLTWNRLPSDSRMYWRARAHKAGRWGPYSLTHGFTTSARVTTADSSDDIGEQEGHDGGPPRDAPDPRVRVEPVDRSAARNDENTAGGDGARTAGAASKAIVSVAGDVGDITKVAASVSSLPSSADRSAGYALRIASVSTAAVGLASLTVAAGSGWYAHVLSEEHSHAGSVFDPARDRRGRTASRLAMISAAGGSVLFATSATLYWLSRRKQTSIPPVRITPVASDHTLGLIVTGEFP